MNLIAVYNHPHAGHKPSEELEVGKSYRVTDISMGGFHTSIFLEGYSGAFNSVQFDFFEDGAEINIYESPKYNPYI